MRPWNKVPIFECGEPLSFLPKDLLRLEPHPYACLGAPYEPINDPFQLRLSVIKRLQKAQQLLQRKEPNLRLAIFDAWRPVAVQKFMIEHAIKNECLSRGIDRENSELTKDIILDVNRFWAPPNNDPHKPPPHSTGAAVDLTLAKISDNQQINMGSKIDAIGDIAEPNHFMSAPKYSKEALWHWRRQLLLKVMRRSGFTRHPNEWWHFSYGDQLWAWKTGANEAIYARAPINLLIA